LEEISAQEMNRILYSNIIKQTALIINNIDQKGINGKMKLILPFLLVSVFFMVNIFKVFYQTQKKKITNQ
jgi:hypothetical protein